MGHVRHRRLAPHRCRALGARRDATQVVNLVSNDVQRLEDASNFAHFLWIGPVETVIVLALIVREVGSRTKNHPMPVVSSA